MILRSVLLSLMFLCGCSSTLIVCKDPPPPKDEFVPVRPSAKMYWHSGHWAWDSGKEIWYWSEGTWEEERPGYIWFPGGWEAAEGQPGCWKWVEDRWVRLVDLDRLEPY